jgi:RNA polymerase sigma-70 factor, ECF subfamily
MSSWEGTVSQADVASAPALQIEEWGQLFTEHHAGVLATCQAILRHREEAEDAAQEVFARAPAAGDGVVDTRRWLLQVARNVCIDTLRHRRRRPTVALDAVAEASSAHGVQVEVVEQMYMRWLLAQLPERERHVLTRQAILDESLETVARRMGVSYAVAGKLAARAKRRVAAIGCRGAVEMERSCAA